MKYLFMLLLITFVAACNKTTDPTEQNKTPNLDGKTTPAIPYPHDKVFFKNHGNQYYENKSTCLSCHGADGSGGNTPVSCKTCHGDFPHPKGWAMTKHQPAFKADRLVCMKCHGGDLQGGNTKVSCNQCHSSFPHPANWAAPAKHGTMAAEDNSECMMCHDNEKKKKNPDTVTCNQCHNIYPHPEKFAFGHMSPPDDKTNDSIASTSDVLCSKCHTDFTKYTTKDTKCMNCHDGNNLRLKWIEPEKPSTNGSLKKNSPRIPSSAKHHKSLEKPVKTK